MNTTPSFVNAWLPRGLQKALASLLIFCLLLMPIAQAKETITYVNHDITGNGLVATNEQAQVLWRERFHPFGQPIVETEPSKSQRAMFHGKPYDRDTGLSYFGARDYDPILGRFMGIDPVHPSPDNIYSFNRYAYGNNNPLKYTDSDGRQSSRINPRAGGAFPILVQRFLSPPPPVMLQVPRVMIYRPIVPLVTMIVKPPPVSPVIAQGSAASRINIRNGHPDQNSSGLEYAWKKHGGNWGANKSAFTISKDELKNLLQSKKVVSSPAYQASSGNFIRTVDIGRNIGIDAKSGGVPTRNLTVITDPKGNLVNTFPGKTN